MQVSEHAHLAGNGKNRFYSGCNRMSLKGLKQKTEIIKFKYGSLSTVYKRI